MLDFYIEDRDAYTQECIAPIVNSEYLTKEIRQYWIEVAVTMNADKLYNTPEEYE